MKADKALIIACDDESTPVIGLHETGRGWRSFPPGEAARAAVHQPHESTTSPAVAGAIAAATSLTPPSTG
jgi:hypothetical protein